LIALLVVAAAGLTIGLAVSLAGIEEIQVSFGSSQFELASSLASACIEDGLERLRNDWNNYSGSLSVGGDSCIINTVVNGGSATITAKGIVDIYSQKIEIKVDNNLEVITWREK